MKNIRDKKLIKWYEMYGDLSQEAKNKLKKLMQELVLNSNNPSDSRLILKGTSNNCRFIREYNGRTHEVILKNGVYHYNGSEYKSLSAIAFEITGTKWNGNRFFGVRK